MSFFIGLRKKKSAKSDSWDDFVKKYTTDATSNNHVLILGTAGSGKAHHPWDNLKPCLCGCKERPLLVYKKDNGSQLYYCNGPQDAIFAVCPTCGRHTEVNTLSDAIEAWNTDAVYVYETGSNNDFKEE